MDDRLVERLHRRAMADRWDLPKNVFADALAASAARAFTTPPDARGLERYLLSLHLEDLALACACAAGHDAAWEQFILEQRPILYRAADALARGRDDGARDLADALYADLYGVAESADRRRSLFRYFHGRSSLATWLRAVLAQRFVDRVRAEKRFEPLPEDETAEAAPEAADFDRPRYLELMQRALGAAMARLAPRDRLRLGCYYVQELTLAQIGRLLREHEATVSRNLARTRAVIRDEVERHLRAGHLSDAEAARCLTCVSADAGPLNLGALLRDQFAPTDTKDTKV